MSYQSLKNTLNQIHPDLKLEENYPLAPLTTFKIGGNCPLIAFPSTLDQVKTCLQEAKQQNIPTIPMGNGSNLLISDQGYQALFLHTKNLKEISLTAPTEIQAQSGILLGKLAYFASEHSLTGLEFAHGIPGTLGGGIRMNAGAYGGELSQVLTSVTSINLNTLETITRPTPELDFSYRHSLFSTTPELILSATLSLNTGEQSEIKETMKTLAEQRKEKQPLQYPSCGSTFKRPPNHFAAALIDQCGLKGYAIGDATVSPLHAGFLINTGKATSKDMRALIAHVQETVLTQTGISLELEVEILSET